MVDDDDGAAEPFTQFVGCFDVVAHIPVVGLAAANGTVESIEDYGRAATVRKLGRDIEDQLIDLARQVEPCGQQIEPRIIAFGEL